jgi:hypothetical protein
VRGLTYNIAEILRIDRLLEELVNQKAVVTRQDIETFRQLKSERKGHVRVIQNYKP